MTSNDNSSDASGARGLWAWWPLRLLAFFFILILLYVGCQLLTLVVAPKWHLASKDVTLLAAGPLTAAVMLLAYWLLVRWTERRRVRELALAGAIPGLLGGALIGIALFCGVYAVMFAYGAVTFHGFGTTDGLAVGLMVALVAAFGEEIVFRGGVYRLLEGGCGTAVALILSGALFGLLHAGNPGATLASTLAIAFEAGILLAAAYTLTRSLWLPIGLHFGWNFTEGGIFGAAVSGHAAKGLINASLSGPAILTGGKFGPEASLPAVGICMAVALVMLVLAARRGEWKPLRFRLRTN